MAAWLAAAALRLATTPHAAPDLAFELDPASGRLMALGRPEALATVAWMAAVDTHAPRSPDPAALVRSLRLIGALDPEWVEPWFFGALMLPAEAVDERRAVLEEAAGLHPDVPWFSWRHGMALLADDRAAALGWLRQAATTPGADPAYAEILARLDAP